MRYIFIAATLLIGFASCQKAETTITREDELRDGKWKMVAGTHRWDHAIGPDTVIHYYDSLRACKKDDYLVFYTNFNGSQNSGDKCDLAEPDAVDFRWELYNNGSAINIWNAQHTFLHQEAVSAPFLSYEPSRFTIQYREFVKNTVNTSLNDTVTYTYTFQKF